MSRNGGNVVIGKGIGTSDNLSAYRQRLSSYPFDIDHTFIRPATTASLTCNCFKDGRQDGHSYILLLRPDGFSD
ncbi:hypothetical protein PGT21_024086 [Puccinia graminis f. sp. tritici]|uniref:Uncharacterized protein n=1 Tax=Puccinia graminis f. sp. tritici TaxID=56615 RepID=A0A5B0LQ30_PUCGR|nr:hypothetical protein PGT21_024086 [Puccinia graminis f. sp. tritici]KAA1072653.1 hypothetical protein PGTUg99_010590 [Puccinia graminis f. sp. tritici]